MVHCSTVQIRVQEHMVLQVQGNVAAEDWAQYGRGYGDAPVI